MTPQLRFPDFTDEWRVKKLGSFSKTFSGGTPTSTNPSFYNGNIPFIKSGEIAKNKTSQNISEEALKKSSAKMVESGDILYALYGATSGQVAISQMNGAINQAILCIRPDANRYFIYSKLAADKNTILETYLQGGQGNLSADIIKKLPIATPSKPEQEKIADFLTAVDERIGVSEKKLELLETYKRGVMQKIFSKQIRFKDENGNPYPDWEEKKLGDIAKKENSPISANEIVGRSGKYKVYGASGLLQTLDSYNQGESYTAIVKDGAGVGRLMWCEAESSVLGTLNIIKPKLNGSSKFLHYLLHTINFQRYSIGSTIPHVYFSDYSKHKLVVPENIEEQQKIANFLTTLDEKTTAEKSKLTAVRQFKKALLQRMFV